MAITEKDVAQVIGYRVINLAYGYQTHHSAMEVALNPTVLEFAQSDISLVHDVGEIARKGDEGWQYSKLSWLKNRVFNAELEEDFSRVWLSGSLLTIGDLLDKHGYFDRHPILEMIRHLRNAVAHGNTFRVDTPHKLAKFPAHNRDAKFQGWNKKTLYEITPGLNGTKFMYDYMEAGNVLDIMLSCGFYLLEKEWPA